MGRVTDTTSCTTHISVTSSPAPPTSEQVSEPVPWLDSPTSPQERTSSKSAPNSASRLVVAPVSTLLPSVALGISPTPTVLVSLRPPSSTSSLRELPTTSDGKACSLKDRASRRNSLPLDPEFTSPPCELVIKINEAANLGKQLII